MSLVSYRRNVRRGVTGRGFPTCYPAAFEKISPRHQLEPSIYGQYADYVARYNATDADGHYAMASEFEAFVNRMAGMLGGLSCQQAAFFRPPSKSAFVRRVSDLLDRNYRVVVNVDLRKLGLELPEGCHALGLVPGEVHGQVRLTSNWKPRELFGPVTIEYLYPLLTAPGEEVSTHLVTEHYPFLDTNVTALPPSSN